MTYTQNTANFTMPATTTKKTANVLQYDAFIRDFENLRAETLRQDLLALIKADGGVKEPIFVYPEEYDVTTEDGKKLKRIFEGNSRHRTLETLAADDQYIVNGGSLNLEYRVVDVEVVKNPVKRLKSQLSFGSIDKRLQPSEYWQGIKAMIAAIIEEIGTPEGAERYPDVAKAISLDEQELATLRYIAVEIGNSVKWLQKMRRTYQSASPKLLDLIQERAIDVNTAGDLMAFSTKSNLEPDLIIETALDCATADSKARITDKYLNQAKQLLTVSDESLLNSEPSTASEPSEKVESISDTPESDPTDKLKAIESINESLKVFRELKKVNFDSISPELLSKIGKQAKTINKAISTLNNIK